jgi:hypothetical protein
MSSALGYAKLFPDQCCAEVSRAGECQPCNKMAVAVADDDDRPWPVCAHHARGRKMIPLADILRAL